MLGKRNLFKTIIYSFILVLIHSCSSNEVDDLTKKDTIAPSITSFHINSISSSDMDKPILVSSTLELNIEATDNIDVTNVAIFINNTKITNKIVPPFNFSKDVSEYNAGDHLLKIVVSDAADNKTTSKDIPIIIDHTLPSITNVSINNNSILAGNTNSLNFTVNDDVGIGSVKVLLDNIVIANITDANYEINIPTTNLSDGEHIIKILATDTNNNSSDLSIKFISDNSGPKIIINAIQENETIYKAVHFNPEITDDYSEISSLEVLYRNERIHLFENGAINSFEFNPHNYATGGGKFKFIAKDVLGNTSELTISTNVAQALMQIKIPENYLSSNIIKSWVFASKSDGTPISIVKIEPGMTEAVLHSSEILNSSEDFMITFFDLESSGRNRISTIQNLTTASLNSLQIPSPNTSSLDSEKNYTINGFSTNDIIKSHGIDYTGTKTNDNHFNLKLTEPNKTNNLYFYTYDKNASATSYKYLSLQRPINNSYSFSKTYFKDQNIVINNFTLQGYFPEVDLNPLLLIIGFNNQNDYTNNIYHEIFNTALGSNTIGSNTPITYPLNTSFEMYRHRLTARKYITERKGTPLANYSAPNWNINYDRPYGSIIKINSTGSEHTVGRLWLKNNLSIGNSYDYSWTLVYDSQKNKNEIVIPTLPDELNELDFYTYSKDTYWQTKQVELSKYQGIYNYDEYVQKVIKNNINYHEVSDYVESVYDVTDFQEYPVFLKDLFN